MNQGDRAQAYGPRSPTQTHGGGPHSPTTAPLLHAHHTTYPHQHHRAPPSPSTTELPPISTALYSRDTAASKYYDPTSDHGERAVARDPARYDNHYSPQVRTHPSPSTTRSSHHHDTSLMHPCEANPQRQQTRESHGYQDTRQVQSPYEKAYQSPVANAYAHQSPLQRPHSQHQHAGGMEAMSHSPVSPSVYQSMSRATADHKLCAAAINERRGTWNTMFSLSHTLTACLRTIQAPPPARADPMSLSSIMSTGNDNDPPAKAQPPPIHNTDYQQLSKPSPNPLVVKQEPMLSPAPEMAPHDNGFPHPAPYQPSQPTGAAHPSPHFAEPRELPVPDEAEIEAALAHIETKQMNDLDTLGAPFEYDEWKQRSLKRGQEVVSGETTKRKVCLPKGKG
jgi:DNA helicase INO80